MGALAFTFERNGVDYNQRWVEGSYTFTGTYVTGGDTLAFTNLRGLRRVDRIAQLGDAANISGLTLRLAGTPTAPLIQVYETQNTEVVNATSLTTRTGRIRIWGT